MQDSLPSFTQPESPPPASAPPGQGIRPGTPAFRKTCSALFLAGFATFALIYCVQPILPEFTRDFHVSPAESSLALSLTTGTLALAILLAGALSCLTERRTLMFFSMAAAAALNTAAAFMPEWRDFLLFRALEGAALGGVPAVALAYLAEEIEPSALGKATGLYVGGSAFGAMLGRIGMSVLTEFLSWRSAMLTLGVLCLLSAFGFRALLPRSLYFKPQSSFDARFHLRAWREHLQNPALLRINATAFLLTGTFVTLFNYTGFRLTEAPYNLSRSAAGMLFLTFGFGVVCSPLAGALADRIGRRPLLCAGFLTMLAGTGLTLCSSLIAITAGFAVITAGFFAAHSAAGGSLGLLANANKGHASSLYLLFYYAGAGAAGSAGGWFWQHGGWPGVCGFCGTLAATGVLLTSCPSPAVAPKNT